MENRWFLIFFAILSQTELLCKKLNYTTEFNIEQRASTHVSLNVEFLIIFDSFLHVFFYGRRFLDLT